jgi:DNA-binding transcriptional regulator YiaG
MTPAELAEARRRALETIERERGFPNIKALRARLGISQAKLAKMIRVSRDTVRGWEHGRSRPRGPAIVLLKSIERHSTTDSHAFDLARAVADYCHAAEETEGERA